MDIVKTIAKYLNTPVGPIYYTSDKVLIMVADKKNVEGLATIILRLAAKSGITMSQEQAILSYQWLEYIIMYASHARASRNFAKSFLQGLNETLEKNTYLIGNYFTITDIAAYHVLYPVIGKLSVHEQESLLHVCRWFKHIQSQPRACGNRKPIPLNTLTLTLLAPAVH